VWENEPFRYSITKKEKQKIIIGYMLKLGRHDFWLVIRLVAKTRLRVEWRYYTKSRNRPADRSGDWRDFKISNEMTCRPNGTNVSTRSYRVMMKTNVRPSFRIGRRNDSPSQCLDWRVSESVWRERGAIRGVFFAQINNANGWISDEFFGKR